MDIKVIDSKRPVNRADKAIFDAHQPRYKTAAVDRQGSGAFPAAMPCTSQHAPCWSVQSL